MKPTLYEALGLSRTAAQSEIKAALRRLVRRYYTKTRAGHADVEEALRFLNHASHILGNPARRAEYDAELAETASSDSTLTTIGGETQKPALTAASMQTNNDGPSLTALGMPREKPAPPAELVPQWSAQLADIRRTRAGQLAGLLVVCFIFLLAWNFALPRGNIVTVLKFTLALLIFLLATSAAVFGIVHLLSIKLWRPPAPEAPITLVEGMIPRWRRDRTVFLGTGAPVEDATWLFRLRMAELKRVSAERVSDPQPVMRLFARLFDYALWGLLALAAVDGLLWVGVIPDPFEAILLHPFIAPIWITAAWIPVEALLLTYVQTTPGRWLLCVYLHYEVSNPYAPEELRFTYGAALRRAAEVWWRGCGGWLPIVALIAMARAREHVGRSGETAWDSQRDCLVTHGPVGNLCLVTAVIGLAASSLVFSSRTREPVQIMAERWQSGWAAVSGRMTAARAPGPAAPAEPTQPRISRVDDIAAPPETAAPAAPAPAAMPSAAPAGQEMVSRPGKAPATAVVPEAPTAVVPDRAPPVAAAPTSPIMNLLPKALRPDVALAQKAAPAEAAPLAEPEPSPMELRNRKVAAYTRQAQRLQAAGDYSGLVKTCERWADEDWRNPHAFYCAGLGLQGIGQHKQAIVMFNKAGSLLSRDDPLKAQIGDAVLRSFRAQSSD